MSDNYYLHFRNAKTKIDAKFFERVANWFISKGWRYLNFWIAGDEINISLENAIKRMPRGGSITFLANHHDLSFRYFNDVALITHPVNFGKNDDFTDLVVEAMTYLYLELRADKAYGAVIGYTSTDEEENALYFEHYVSCFNIFNPEIMKKVNKNNLKHINVCRKEYLNDGSLLLVLSKNPRDVSGEEMKRVRRLLFG